MVHSARSADFNCYSDESVTAWIFDIFKLKISDLDVVLIMYVFFDRDRRWALPRYGNRLSSSVIVILAVSHC
jgi:hypothetical protein